MTTEGRSLSERMELVVGMTMFAFLILLFVGLIVAAFLGAGVLVVALVYVAYGGVEFTIWNFTKGALIYVVLLMFSGRSSKRDGDQSTPSTEDPVDQR